MATITSKWAGEPIQLTESLDHAVWQGAGQMKIPGGFLLVKNDAHYLYAALDLTEDTGDDPAGNDYFWFTFDRNRNGAINANMDVNYGLYPSFPDKMGRQYYLGPGSWTGLVNEVSQSRCKRAFEASPNSATAHRVWKMRFLLTDLSISLIPWLYVPYTRFGIRTHSSAPSFTYDTPSNFFTNFGNLHTLYLSRKPAMASTDLGPVMGSVGLIPSTRIDATTGKATTDPAYMVPVQNAAFGGLLNIIGNRTALQNLWSQGTRRYKILHREGTSGAFSELRCAWYNYEWNGTDYILESFGPDMANYYVFPNPTHDYSIDDLLVQLDSRKFNKGIHQFKVTFFDLANNTVAAAAQTLSLYIDNSLPIVQINAIRHGAANVDACAIVNLSSDTDGLTFDFDAYDPEGNLQSYSLSASHGNGNTETIMLEQYAMASGPSWEGVHHKIAPAPPEVWVPEETCAYAFTVTAWSRTTNGYVASIGYNQISKYITLIKPVGARVASPRLVLPKGVFR